MPLRRLTALLAVAAAVGAARAPARAPRPRPPALPAGAAAGGAAGGARGGARARPEQSATLVLDARPDAAHAGTSLPVARDFDGAEGVALRVRAPAASGD